MSVKIWQWSPIPITNGHSPNSQIMSNQIALRLCLVVLVSHLEFVDWLVSPVSQQCQCQASQRILGTNTLEEGRSVIFCDKESRASLYKVEKRLSAVLWQVEIQGGSLKVSQECFAVWTLGWRHLGFLSIVSKRSNLSHSVVYPCLFAQCRPWKRSIPPDLAQIGSFGKILKAGLRNSCLILSDEGSPGYFNGMDNYAGITYRWK